MQNLYRFEFDIGRFLKRLYKMKKRTDFFAVSLVREATLGLLINEFSNFIV